jgi:IS5 family transposase
LLRALLLQMLYSVRSERMLMEQLEYNLLFRWFVGMSANEPVWHPTVFTKNRNRLLEGAVSEEFFSLIVAQARGRKLLSDEHFTVDGTLIEAWAGQKSFRRKDSDNDPLNPPPPDRGSNPTVNWHKEKRSNETHESITDSMARLYKKTRGAEARLGYLGHVLTENRNGLVVDVRLTQASGTAERDAALAMLGNKPLWRRITLGGDRGYDTRGFVAATRDRKVTPHVAQNESNRRSAIDHRTTRHEGYGISQVKRKRVEEVFGWMKTVALQRKTRFRGTGSRGLDVHLRGCRLQPGSDAQPSGRHCIGRSVSFGGKDDAFRPPVPPRDPSRNRIAAPQRPITKFALPEEIRTGRFSASC